MEREIYMRLAVELAARAVNQAARDVDSGDDVAARYVEHALLRAKKYAAMSAKIWGKELVALTQAESCGLPNRYAGLQLIRAI